MQAQLDLCIHMCCWISVYYVGNISVCIVPRKHLFCVTELGRVSGVQTWSSFDARSQKLHQFNYI